MSRITDKCLSTEPIDAGAAGPGKTPMLAMLSGVTPDTYHAFNTLY